MFSWRRFLPGASAVFIICGSLPARADGKFVTPHLLRPPEIPSQSAAISFAEGKQVLTIWNTVQTTAGETAWVLPLPSRPDAIQKTAPESFKVLETLCAPEVKTGQGGLGEVESLALGLFSLLWAGLLLGLRRADETQPEELGFLRRFGLGVFFCLSLVLLAGPMGGCGIPKFRAAAAGLPTAGVEELDAQTVGAYETTVLATTGSGPLNEWLRNGGFPEFTGTELATVDDYAARGWVFLCARMQLDQGKPRHAPHPLTVRFPTDKVIYPMRLTAGSGPAVEVRLFVIGSDALRDPTARLKPFIDAPVWQQFQRRIGSRGIWSSDQAREYSDFRETGPNEYDRRKGIPPDLLYDTLWAAAWHSAKDVRISLLTGTFRPEDDWSDIQLVRTSEPPAVPRLATARALQAQRSSMAILIAAPLLLILAVMARIRTPRDGSRPGLRRLLKVSGTAIAVYAAVSLIPWNAAGVTIVEPEQVNRSPEAFRNARAVHDAWVDSILRK